MEWIRVCCILLGKPSGSNILHDTLKNNVLRLLTLIMSTGLLELAETDRQETDRLSIHRLDRRNRRRARHQRAPPVRRVWAVDKVPIL
jgi:hypothetical protein